MYDIKPEVFAQLKEIAGVTISDAYPKDFSMLPHISFYEPSNNDPLGIKNSPLTAVAIQVDIWHNKSTGTLAAEVDVRMNSIGLRRDFSADVPDPSGIKHKTMRYRGVVDSRSGRVTQ
ncbi:hypothetical protein [Paenibacillus illinoisensis]|uniref:hypothetical protein n=1 Tax=Paenibacillus illinoisensis TaxID=59845 RepID=UPI000FDC8772|nr:hypothetical protein [Paenibacillus illinoisensis]